MGKALLACMFVAMAASATHAQDPWAWEPIVPSPAPLVAPALPALPTLPTLPALPALPRLPGLTAPTPNSGSSFDYLSGNSYRWSRDLDGSTRVNGTNIYTGSTWKQTIKPDGSMTGWDSKMNPWQYDSRTKTYMNFGTGEMCVGSGASRYCF